MAPSYSLSHLSDQTLLRDLATLVVRDRAATAVLLAHLSEVDARKLYLPMAYPSMYAYCIGELRLSEEAAFKRIHAARAARQFPAIFAALAEGRLHLSAVVMLAPHLTLKTVDELLVAASYKSKSEIEQLLAQRFPRPDVPARVQPLPQPAPPAPATEQLSSGTVGREAPAEQHAPGRVEAPAPRPKVAPLAPQRFALQLTMGQEMHDDLRYAQELLSHQIPTRDVAEVLHRALKALIGQLQKRKFAANGRVAANEGRRRAVGISPQTSSAPSGSAMGANAPLSAQPVGAARRGLCSSSITSTKWRGVARRRWGGSGCGVGPITSTGRSARLERSS